MNYLYTILILWAVFTYEMYLIFCFLRLEDFDLFTFLTIPIGFFFRQNFILRNNGVEFIYEKQIKPKADCFYSGIH